MPSRSIYVYTPLDPVTQEIRLITLRPSANLTAAVDLTLSTVSLLTKPAYEAISYVWGDQNITAPITLDGVSVEVTTNLEAALRHLRLESEERILWADAICINQQDDLEKNVQVSMMGEIYKSCSKCLAWLGEDPEGHGKVAFDMIEDIAAGGKVPFEECTGDVEHSAAKLISAEDIMKRPYWTRMWVIQETVLPAQVEYWCGKSILARTILTRAAEPTSYQHMAYEPRLCDRCTGGLAFTTDPVNAIISRSKSSGLYVPDDSFWVLKHTRNLLCQNPLDKVYAIRALMGTSFRSGIVVDYQHATLKTLAVQVLQADVIENDSLRMLGLIDRLEDEGGVACPSWWPDPYWHPKLTSFYKHAPDPQPRMSQDAHFRACGSAEAYLDSQRIEDGILGVSSLLCDIIDETKQFEAIGSATFMSWLKRVAGITGMNVDEELVWRSNRGQPQHPSSREGLICNQYIGGGTVSNAWWRTLISDHVLDSSHSWSRADSSEEKVLWSVWNKLSSNSVASFSASVSQDRDPEFYLFVVFHYTTDDRSFLTTHQGYMGVGPRCARSGDEVHIVAGSNWPLLLRRVSDETETSPVLYRCLGKCYVHGIMDGEAAGRFEDQASKIYLV